jgi:hypothetical protein
MYTLLDQEYGNKDTFRVPEDINRFYYQNGALSNQSIEVYFEASPFANSVQWKIGNDARVFTQQKFFLKFQSITGKIDVRLIQNRYSNSCFPKDDGVDTLYKSFYVVDARVEQPILGRFKGSVVGQEQDTFTVTTHYFASTPGLQGYYFLKNLPKGNNAIPRGDFPHGQGDVIGTLGNKFNFRSFYGFGEIYNAGLVYSLGSVQNDSLVVKYELTGNSGKGTFIGIRQK